MISERDFAVFDNLMLREKPNATVTALETLIMCSTSRPSTWLDSLDDSSRAGKHEEARKSAALTREKMKERRAVIIAARKEKIEANRKEQEEKRNELKKKS